MRKIKIFALVLMVLTSFSSWAAVGVGKKLTSLEQLDNTEAFTLTAIPNGTDDRGRMVIDGTYLKTTQIGVVVNTNDPAQQFQIVKDNEKYYLKSVALQQFAKYNSEHDASFVDDIANATAITLTPDDTPATYWKIYFAGTGNTGRFNGGANGSISINGWDQDDAGNKMVIESVGDASNVTSVAFTVENGGTTVESGTSYVINGTATYLPSYLAKTYAVYKYSAETISTETTAVTATYQYFNSPFLISYPDFASAKWYNMTIRDEEKFVTYDSSSSPNVKWAGTNAQNNQMWAFVGDPYNGFTIYNKDNTDLTVGYQDNPEGMHLSADNTAKWFLQSSGNRTNGFYLRYNSTTGSRPNEQGGILKYWDGADAGSTFVVEEPRLAVNYIIKYNGKEVARAEGIGAVVNGAPSIPAAYKRDYCTYEYDPIVVTAETSDVIVNVTWNGPALSADVASANWQNLAIRGNWYVTSDNVDGDGALKTVNANAIGLVEDAYQWALVGDPYHIQLFNKAQTNNNFGYSDAAKVNSGVPAFQDATSYWTLKQGTSDLGGFVLFAEGTNLQINQFGGPGGSLKFWQNGATNDAGSAFTIFDVPTDFSSYVTDLAPYFEATGYFKGLTETTKTNAGWDAALKTACTFEQYKKLREAIDGLTADSYIYPETGYYRLKNQGRGGYMGLIDGQLKGYYNSHDNDASTVVLLTKGTTDKTYSIKVQGQYVQAASKSNAVAVDNSNETFFTAYIPSIPASGVVGFSVGGEEYTYLHKGGGANDDAQNILGWSINETASRWIVEDVTSINVALTESDGHTYATLCVPFGVTLPENVDAYAISSVGDRAQTAKLEGKDIPAGTAVILRGESDVTSITATIKNDIDTFEGTNALQGTYTEKALGADDLVLGISGDTGIGFYKKAGENPVLGANKAYLTISSESPVKSFALSFDDMTTGISEIVNGLSANDKCFDLSGRAVKGSLHKGIYIMDGKKVLVK